jgi:hypothetical protein
MNKYSLACVLLFISLKIFSQEECEQKIQQYFPALEYVNLQDFEAQIISQGYSLYRVINKIQTDTSKYKAYRKQIGKSTKIDVLDMEYSKWWISNYFQINNIKSIEYNEYENKNIFSSYQMFKLKLFIWESYLLNIKEQYKSDKLYIDDKDTLKNGWKIVETINIGLSAADSLLKTVNEYKVEFIPLFEIYDRKTNKKNLNALCSWLELHETFMFKFKPVWSENKIPNSTYGKAYNFFYKDNVWNNLPEKFKVYFNSLIVNEEEIENLVKGRKYNQESFTKWENPLAVFDNINKQVIIFDPKEKAEIDPDLRGGTKFLTIHGNSVDLFLTGDQFGLDWKESKKVAEVKGGDWGLSKNVSSNQKEGTEAYIISRPLYEFNDKTIKTSVLKFSNGEGSITHSFKPKANYDKDMEINTEIRLKIQNDTLFEKVKDNWEVVYWASSNNPEFKNLAKEVKLREGYSRNAFVIGDKNTTPKSKARALGIGDKHKTLLMLYIANDFLKNVAAFEILRTGDAVLYKEQVYKQLEEDEKTCSYCGSIYTGITHLATYDKANYQCGEREVSNYKEHNKIFCSAKCALEYCRKTH